MKFPRRAAAPLLAAGLCACTNLFLQPDRVLHLKPERVGAVYETVDFTSADGTKLCGLWFPSRKGPGKGVVVQFHGNGENETSHFLYVYWLALEGWDVFAFDYRGYGASGGSKSLAGAVADGAAALAYARGRAAGRPLVVVGQSLGGEIALAALDRDGGEGLRALVLDSTFLSNQRIAQEKLSRLWLTWPLQWPLSRLLISDRYAARRFIARRRPVPLLMLHAREDDVVPYEMGRALYDAAPGPKEFWDVPGRGHTLAFGPDGAEFRPRLKAWLEAVVAKPAP